MKSEDKYLLNGNIVAGLAKLAVPIVLSSFTQNIMNLVDIYWLGKISKDFVAAVSVSGIFFMLFTTLSVGVSTGAVAVVSNLFAKGKMKDVNICSLDMAIFSFLLGFFGCIVGFLVAKGFFGLFGLSDSVLAGALEYTKVYLMGGWILLYNFLLIAVIRGMGDSLSSFKAILIINLINFIFDPVFIYGFGIIPAMKAKGAALATVLGHIFGFIYLTRIGMKKGILDWRKFAWKGRIVLAIVKIGLPASLRIGMRTVLNMIIIFLVSGFGTAAIAAYGIGQKIIMTILIAGFSLGSAAATMVGQNLGAGKYERAKKGIYWAAGIYMFLNLLVMLVFLMASRHIIYFFNKDSEVVNIGSAFLKILSPVLIINAAGLVVSRAIGGAGDTLIPSLLNVLIMMCYQVPAAYLLSKKTNLGITGIFIAEASALFFISVATLIWFKTDKWLEQNAIKEIVFSD